MHTMTISTIRLEGQRSVIPKQANLEDFERAMVFAAWVHRGCAWWLGDMVNRGIQRHGDRFWQAVPEGFSLDALNRYATVCRKVPAEIRRSELSYTHHMKVANFPPHQIPRLLDIAVTENMNSQQFAKYLAKERKKYVA